MSGYITRNALMIDNPTFGPPTQTSMLPTTLANPLANSAGWGTPQVQAGTGGVDLAMPAGTMSNDDLMKALAALYGGQAPGQQFQDARQQGMQSGYPIIQSDRDKLLLQAIGTDTGRAGREGGGLV